jgi:WD40 repeat protein
MGVQVGEGNTQIIYTYNRLTWTDGVAPPPLVSVSGAVDSPYRGLSAFEEQDAAFFFGREAATTEVLERMSRLLPDSGLMVVSGVSGAGKSSLLRAGVLPRIRGAGLASTPEAARWPCLLFTPGRVPLDELALRVAALAGADAAAVRRGLDADPAGFALTARQAALASPPAPRPGQAGRQLLLLVVDQFEQVFTQCADERQRQAFITALCGAAGAGPETTGHQPAALVVLGVRADFEGRCANYRLLAGPIQDRYLVTAMTERQLRIAITEPARKAGSRVDADLVDVLLAEVHARQPGAGGAGVLPLLSHALDQAWRSRTGEALTLTDYERTGGIEGAVADSAQRAYDRLTPGQQAAARQIFTRLTAISTEGADTVDRATRAELGEGKSAAEIGDVQAVLEAFASERLLTLAADSVEISHEVLPAAWPLLRDTWLAETHADRIVRSRLHNVAAEWERQSRDSSYLYSGSLLQAAAGTAARAGADPVRYPPLTRTERDFMAASKQAASGRRRRRRAIMGALVILLIAALAGAGIAAAAASSANRQRMVADQQRAVAVSGQLAAESEAILTGNPATAAMLAAAAWRIAPTAVARDSMLDVLGQPDRGVLLFGGGDFGGATSVAFSPDSKTLAVTGPDGVSLWDVTTHRQIGASFAGKMAGPVAFSPDGRILAVAGADGARLWGATTRRPIGSPFDTSTAIEDVTFNWQGNALASVDQNGIVQIWDVATRTQIGPPLGHGVLSVAFSPDGQTLATVDENGKARLWSLPTHHQLGGAFTIGSGVAPEVVAFSPDGQTLATADDDGPARLWTVATHAQIGGPLSSGTGGVDSVAFSPDGKTLATAGDDGTARLWDLATRTQIGVALGDDVQTVAFSPDGTTLATLDGDGTVRLWDLTAHDQIGGPISADTDGVDAVAFSRDGTTLATIGGDAEVRLWNVTTRTQIGAPIGNRVTWIAFSPDGQTLALADGDGTVRLWDVATDSQVGAPLGSQESGVAFSPDGKVLAAWGASGAARLWDVTTGTQIGALLPSGVAGTSPGSVDGVAFNPAGNTLATLDYNGNIRLWDEGGRRQIGAPIPAGIPGALTDGDVMAFSPDGKILATVSNDGTARLWDVATHAQIGTPLGTSGVASVAFSPDGRTLATVAGNGVVLWDVATHAQVGASLGTGNVEWVAFSPDGRTLATASDPGSVQLWGIASPRDVLNSVCLIAGRSLTRREWTTYAPSEPFQRVCG